MKGKPLFFVALFTLILFAGLNSCGDPSIWSIFNNMAKIQLSLNQDEREVTFRIDKNYLVQENFRTYGEIEFNYTQIRNVGITVDDQEKHLNPQQSQRDDDSIHLTFDYDTTRIQVRLWLEIDGYDNRIEPKFELEPEDSRWWLFYDDQPIADAFEKLSDGEVIISIDLNNFDFIDETNIEPSDTPAPKNKGTLNFSIENGLAVLKISETDFFNPDYYTARFSRNNVIRVSGNFNGNDFDDNISLYQDGFRKTASILDYNDVARITLDWLKLVIKAKDGKEEVVWLNMQAWVIEPKGEIVETSRDGNVHYYAEAELDTSDDYEPEPTAEPTATPTAEPTATPTAEPTATPTAEPTAEPDEDKGNLRFSIENGLAVIAIYEADFYNPDLYTKSFARNKLERVTGNFNGDDFDLPIGDFPNGFILSSRISNYNSTAKIALDWLALQVRTYDGSLENCYLNLENWNILPEGRIVETTRDGNIHFYVEAEIELPTAEPTNTPVPTATPDPSASPSPSVPIIVNPPSPTPVPTGVPTLTPTPVPTTGPEPDICDINFSVDRNSAIVRIPEKDFFNPEFYTESFSTSEIQRIQGHFNGTDFDDPVSSHATGLDKTVAYKINQDGTTTLTLSWVGLLLKKNDNTESMTYLDLTKCRANPDGQIVQTSGDGNIHYSAEVTLPLPNTPDPKTVN